MMERGQPARELSTGSHWAMTQPSSSTRDEYLTGTFLPERWSSGAAPSPIGEFDPFLAGARHCPGRELILFVCTSALAVLLGTQRLMADPPLAPAALPLEFPRRGIRFRT